MNNVLDLNNDKRFRDAINQIILDKKIITDQYSSIFLYFPSRIIQKIFCKLSKRIKNFHRYGETNIVYEIFHNCSYSFTRRYCHLYSQTTVFNKLDNTYICNKCTKKQNCLIIVINENEFYNYFNFLFNNINFK